MKENIIYLVCVAPNGAPARAFKTRLDASDYCWYLRKEHKYDWAKVHSIVLVEDKGE